MFKNALVSVSDKTGLAEFLKPLAEKGMRIVSTGGTAQFLRMQGLEVVEVEEQTQFPEIMDGRVKTLHPKIHMGLLARPQDDAVLKKYGVEKFDLVVVNLYPFEKALLAKQGGEKLSESDMIEKIDVGGPSMIRAAAKNFSSVTVVCDPRDYNWLAKKDKIAEEDRRILAGKAFAHTARYDALISHFFGAFWGEEIAFGGLKARDLRYGENPQQKATWYRFSGDDRGLHAAQVVQGKELSYNNILDLEAATSLATSLGEGSTVIVKHNNPCGVGIPTKGEGITDAVQKALKADPVSAFGGIAACNGNVSGKEAQLLTSIFLECVIAPDFSPDALEVFKEKKNLRILRWSTMNTLQRAFELRSLAGGFLIQSADQVAMNADGWKFLGQTPDEEVLRDLLIAEKVCAALKSNSIAIVRHGQSLGLGMGQVNRVEAVEHAIARMKHHHSSTTHAVLASDAFFPFPDSIERIAAAGIHWVLQPGGSVKDQDVFEAARKHGVHLVITGQRHFRH